MLHSTLKSQTVEHNNKWQPFLSFTNAHPDFSRTTFNLNNQLDIRFFNEDLWSSYQIEAGAYYKSGKTNKVKVAIGYQNTRQWLQYRNYLSNQDLIDFGVPTFQVLGLSYDHKRLLLQSSIRQYLFHGFFAEPGLTAAFNVSGKNKDDFFTAPQARNIYEPLYNTARDLNAVTLFGSLTIGYEYKGFFAGYFHEMNLTPVNHQFTFRSNSYDVKYRHWINRGVRVGYLFTLNNPHQKNKAFK